MLTKRDLSLGERVRSAREAIGLSKRKLAAKVGISDIHLGRIEKNQSEPTVSVLLRIADGLGVDIKQFLVGRQQHLSPAPEKLRELKHSLSQGIEITAHGEVDISDQLTVKALEEVIERIKLKEEQQLASGEGEKDPLRRAYEVLKDRDFQAGDDLVGKFCSKMGISISEADLPEPLKGLCGKSQKGVSHILLNRRYPNQRIYIITHEILHLLSGFTNTLNSRLVEQIDRMIADEKR